MTWKYFRAGVEFKYFSCYDPFLANSVLQVDFCFFLSRQRRRSFAFRSDLSFITPRRAIQPRQSHLLSLCRWKNSAPTATTSATRIEPPTAASKLSQPSGRSPSSWPSPASLRMASGSRRLSYLPSHFSTHWPYSGSRYASAPVAAMTPWSPSIRPNLQKS